MREIDLQIDDFMIECGTKGLSKRTINEYESTLRLFANYLEREFGVESANDVKQIHLRAYTRYLQESGKYTVEKLGKLKTSRKPKYYIKDE